MSQRKFNFFFIYSLRGILSNFSISFFLSLFFLLFIYLRSENIAKNFFFWRRQRRCSQRKKKIVFSSSVLFFVFLFFSFFYFLIVVKILSAVYDFDFDFDNIVDSLEDKIALSNLLVRLRSTSLRGTNRNTETRRWRCPLFIVSREKKETWVDLYGAFKFLG